MNPYYLVPSVGYEQPVLRNINRSDFDSTTERIVNNPRIDEYQRGVALQQALTKYLNKGKKKDEKDEIKALLKDVLKEGTVKAESTPVKPVLKSILKTSYRTPNIQDEDSDGDFSSAASRLQFQDAEDELDDTSQGVRGPVAPILSSKKPSTPLDSPADLMDAMIPSRKSTRTIKEVKRLTYHKMGGGWIPHN